jgi:hypothetical protein
VLAQRPNLGYYQLPSHVPLAYSTLDQKLLVPSRLVGWLVVVVAFERTERRQLYTPPYILDVFFTPSRRVLSHQNH